MQKKQTGVMWRFVLCALVVALWCSLHAKAVWRLERQQILLHQYLCMVSD